MNVSEFMRARKFERVIIIDIKTKNQIFYGTYCDFIHKCRSWLSDIRRADYDLENRTITLFVGGESL